jgi:hypothetical protein
MTSSEIESIVLRAIETLNLARKPEARLQVSPQAPIFGPDSPLDSLGLVSLLIDIEEALSAAGADLVLSDARAMSSKASPFRSVPALVAHIEATLATA